MKIIYKQTLPSGALLDSQGIQNCYVKDMVTQRDGKGNLRKLHYHTDYEVHFVKRGDLLYEVEGSEYILNFGQFLLLPPRTLHRVLQHSADASTVSITFRMIQDKKALSEICNCKTGQVTPRMWDTIAQMLSEYQQPQPMSAQWMSAAVWEMLVLLWRLCGAEDTQPPMQEKEEDSRLALAKQYIADNLEFAPTIEEVSAYCHLCPRQLNRLFTQWENTTPKAYIQRQRIEKIQTMLRMGNLSLRDISERMNFSSEYYFSCFFRKYAGMAPGEYRKMHTSE